MHQADDASDRIDEINCTAIRDVNPKTETTLVGHDSVTAIETSIFRQRLIDLDNLVAMNLLGGRERPLQ